MEDKKKLHTFKKLGACKNDEWVLLGVVGGVILISGSLNALLLLLT